MIGRCGGWIGTEESLYPHADTTKPPGMPLGELWADNCVSGIAVLRVEANDVLLWATQAPNVSRGERDEPKAVVTSKCRIAID